MKKVDYIISTFLLIYNFLNASGTCNIQQKLFKETLDYIYQNQVLILESKHNSEKQMKRFHEDSI